MGSTSKITNPDWPDPSDWVNRLYQELSARQAIYESETDVLLKRNKAAAMLGCVLSSLTEFPNFKNHTAHLPLKDLLIFLSDLDLGRAHPWSAPVKFGGTNLATTAQSELKSWVRAAYALLTRNGFKPVQAYQRIAEGLTKSGRTDREKGPVRWRRVGEWCRESEKPRDVRIRERVHGWWEASRDIGLWSNVVNNAGKPLSDKEMAGMCVDSMWGLPHLRDRSVSAP